MLQFSNALFLVLARGGICGGKKKLIDSEFVFPDKFSGSGGDFLVECSSQRVC